MEVRNDTLDSAFPIHYINQHKTMSFRQVPDLIFNVFHKND